MMTVTTAMRYAEEDMDLIRAWADTARKNGNDETVIVDGSNLSPSWRALNGGALVWEHGYEGESMDPHDAYLHVLDMATDDYGEGTDWFLTWDDGCLWLKRAD